MSSDQTSEIAKIDYSDNIDYRLIVLTIGLTLIISGLTTIFISPIVGQVLGACYFSAYLGFKTIPTVYSVYQKNKKIDQINSSLVYESPHEIIDNFFEWEKRDRVKMKNPISKKDMGSLYYQGVLDNGTIVFTHSNRKIERISDENEVIVIPPKSFQIYLYDNKDLNERVEKNKLEKIKNGLKNSKYEDILKDAKNELDRLSEGDSERQKKNKLNSLEQV